MRNRRRVGQSLRFMVAIKLVSMAGFLTIMGLVFVMQNTTIKRLNDDIIEREQRLSTLEDELRIKRALLARLQNPEWLRRRIAEMGLDLQEVRVEQIVRAYGMPLAGGSRMAHAEEASATP